MRRSQASFFTKHKKQQRYTQDLVTTAEAYIKSPGLSSQTTKMKKQLTNNRSQTSAKGFQILDQQNLQEVSSLFITNEQAAIFSKILELKRKGKINAHNSFELPIKVIDPKCTERINVEFWKLASEILGSSTSIYDKRVDNVYLTSNKIMDQLLRIKEKDQYTEQLVNKSQVKQKAIQKTIDLNLSVQGLKINLKEVGFIHTEPIVKLNSNQMKRNNYNDNLLLLNSKGIDCNSNSGLMFNILEIGSDLIIELHHNQYKQNIGQIQEKRQNVEGSIFTQIEQNYKNLSQLAKRQMYNQISRYKQQHLLIDVEEQKFQHIFQSLNVYNQVSFLQSHSIYNVNPQESALNQLWSNDFQTIDMNSRLSTFTKPQYSYKSKEIFQKSFITNLQEKKDSFIIVGPQEMYFKQMKLQKKDKSKNISRQSKKTIIRNELEIDFSMDEPQFREEIFSRARKEFSKIFSSKKTEDKYLLPKTINPHIQIEKQKKLRKIVDQKQYCTQNPQVQLSQQIQVNKESVILQTSLMHNISPSQDYNHEIYKDARQVSIQQELNNLHPQQIKNINTFGIRNIRQIKQLVLMHLTKKGYIKISQLQCGLTPAEMLIVFLHLANQKNLGIQSTDNQFDVRLFINN